MLKKKFVHILLFLLAAAFVLPLLLTLTGSFMSPGEVMVRFGEGEEFGRPDGPTLIPNRVSLSQFYELLVENYSYIGMFWNSVLYAVVITLCANLFIIPLAFGFAKLRFRGSDALFFLFLLTMMMPFQVTLLPIYIVLNRTELLNTAWALILPSIFAPLGVFLLRQFLRGTPDELLEAASLETNSFFHLLTRIIIPSAKNGLIAMNILIFTEAWNMIEQPLLFLEDSSKYPLSAAMNGIQSTNLGVSFAGSLLFLAPVVVLYLCFEEQIIAGMENYKW